MDKDQEQFANAEITNGRWAMIGIISALGAYAYTGQIIPGVFKWTAISTSGSVHRDVQQWLASGQSW